MPVLISVVFCLCFMLFFFLLLLFWFGLGDLSLFVLRFFETVFLCVVCCAGVRLAWAPGTREAAAVTWGTQAGVRGDLFLDMLWTCTDTVDQ